MPPRKPNRWSAKVTDDSDALDLEKNIFTWNNPHRIAYSLKKSAERSTRRKSTPYAAAMAMLNFYINRAGKKLSNKQKAVLEKTKDELYRIFHRYENN